VRAQHSIQVVAPGRQHVELDLFAGRKQQFGDNGDFAGADPPAIQRTKDAPAKGRAAVTGILGVDRLTWQAASERRAYDLSRRVASAIVRLAHQRWALRRISAKIEHITPSFVTRELEQDRLFETLARELRASSVGEADMSAAGESVDQCDDLALLNCAMGRHLFRARITGALLPTSASRMMCLELWMSCTCFVPLSGNLSDSGGIERDEMGLNVDRKLVSAVRLPPPPPYNCLFFNQIQVSILKRVSDVSLTLCSCHLNLANSR
jgi:hypothetical protein